MSYILWQKPMVRLELLFFHKTGKKGSAYFLLQTIFKVIFSSYQVDMGEGLKQRYHGAHLPGDEDDEELFDSDSFSSNEEDDVEDEEASSNSDPSPPPSKSSSLQQNLNQNGPLYQLSSLMEELPIKRGLSKYYQGKSQSYTSLAVVSSIEDLPKKEAPCRRKMMKTCKSYAGGLDSTHSKTISKKAPRVPSCASFMSKSSSSSLLYSNKPPLVPVQKNPCTH